MILLLLSAATIEEETNICTERHHPRTLKDHKLFKKTWVHVSRHIIINTVKRRQENLQWEGHCVTDICYNPSKLIEF